MNKPKLLYLSSIATPQQIKFCDALRQFFDAKFWFYESPARTRGSWWQIELGAHCSILPRVYYPTFGPFDSRYWARGLADQLDQANPDIVMLGGFSIPSNFVAYRWSRRRGKKTVVFTERSRTSSGVLRKRGVVWRLLRLLYRHVDVVVVSADDAVEQFRDELGFGDKVVAGQYASDIDEYFGHALREPKRAYTYLFANRLTEIYNPIGAIDIFDAVRRRYPGSRLMMNAAGELGDECHRRVSKLGLGQSVEFLTALKSWDELHEVYERADILLLPARFSNGNFTILEAMASGMGIVVSDQVLGIGNLIEDEKNGFNCEPSTDAFLDRIERYVSRPGLLKQHAIINRRLVRPFGVQGTAELFAKLLTEKLGTQGWR